MDNYNYKTVLRPLLHKLTPAFANRRPTVVKNALILTLAILRARTTCLNALKGEVGAITGAHATLPASHYKRLVRFFDDHAATGLHGDLLAAAVGLLRRKARHLVLDGTSWHTPTGPIHLLTLCVLYDGVAVPILWTDLAKKGASSVAERKRLLDAAFARYDLRGMCLLADREYIGPEWFTYLADNGLDFCIRSRDYAYFRDVEAGGRLPGRIREAIAAVRRSRKPNKARAYAFRLSPDGPRLYFVIARNPDPKAGERVMYLVTTVCERANGTVARYLKRWSIEHCFRQLKSNGFDLERVNLATGHRRRLLIAAVVLAYAVSVTEGLRTYRRLVPVKTHGTDARSYPAVSVFRHGLDRLSRHKTDLERFCRYLAVRLKQTISGNYSPLIPNV